MSLTLVRTARQDEGNFLRIMLKSRMRLGETLSHFMIRSTRTARGRYAALGFRLVEEILLQRQARFVAQMAIETPKAATTMWMIDSHEVRSETEWRILSASAKKNEDIGVQGIKRWRHPLTSRRQTWSRVVTFEDAYLETPMWFDANEDFASKWQQRFVETTQWDPMLDMGGSNTGQMGDEWIAVVASP